MITYVANESPEIFLYQTLGELKAKIDNYVEKYGCDAMYNINVYDDSVTEHIEYKRLETDGEYQARIEREQRIKQQKEEKERQEFERLKAKYGTT